MEPAQKEYSPQDVAQKWHKELALSKEQCKDWIERGKKIVKRYRDHRNSNGYSGRQANRFNVLWSNIQTLLPATYAKTPKPEVERRHKDQDPVGRTASQILERSLQYELDENTDFDQAIKMAIVDRLLPGRGTAWVRFETKERVTNAGSMQYECTPVDYVYWEDFACQPARNWSEVTWVARRVYMTKKAVVERFGEEFKDVPLTHEPIGLDEMRKNGQDVESMKKAQVWEIWDKEKKEVCWVAHGYDKALDCRDDPYGLDGFWPCPKPLFSTQSTDTIIPVPDFSLYQDQADEIDLLTTRINVLIRALKVVGVYDASQNGVQRMLNEGVDNTLVPIETWGAFSEKGGLKGAVDFMPLDQVVLALSQCYQSRDRAVQVVYEITGLSDIVRGASNASETATAQQIKSNFASLRLKTLQRDVAMFATEILRIKAQLMSDLYSPNTLVEASGIQMTSDAGFTDQALHLIKSEPARNYKINISADSLVEIDESQEKQDRIDFLTATGGFLQQALPAAQQVPELAPLLAEMLLFGVRAFKAGRPLENAFDQAMVQLSQPKQQDQPKPDPEQIKAQANMQIEREKFQGTMQLEQFKLQSTQSVENLKLKMQMQVEQIKMQGELQLQDIKMQHDMQMERMRQQFEIEKTRLIEASKQSTAIATAEINADAQQHRAEPSKGDD